MKSLINILFILSLSFFSHAERIVFTGSVNFGAPQNEIKKNGFSYGLANDFFKIEYALEVWSLFGEPVVRCHAKWGVDLPGDVSIGFNVEGSDDKVTIRGSEISSYIKIWGVKILVPIRDNVFMVCDPGVMSDRAGENSFDTPGSPDWDDVVFIKNNTVSFYNNKKFLHRGKKSRYSKFLYEEVYRVEGEGAKELFRYYRNKLSQYRSGESNKVSVLSMFNARDLMLYDDYIKVIMNPRYSKLIRAKYEISGLLEKALERIDQDERKVVDRLENDGVKGQDILNGMEDIFRVSGLDEERSNLNDKIEGSIRRKEGYQSRVRDRLLKRRLPRQCRNQEFDSFRKSCIKRNCGMWPFKPSCSGGCTPGSGFDRCLVIPTFDDCSESIKKSYYSEQEEYEECVERNSSKCSEGCVVK